MSELALRVHGLSKRYAVGAAPKATMLREQIAGWAARSLRGRRGPPVADFWALSDVSFDVHRGEVVSLIGRNGAGKSTLLKILSRIVEPTRGRAELYGRIGSLLEVGTGFHPELSGRENVYLNAAILGMRRSDIGRRFDEIVAFAELAEFIDNPLRTYSTGMRLRLAFAVAITVEPEILVVDEVLAVGDRHFQQKCVERITTLRHRGCSLVLCSHDLGLVGSLSDSIAWLDAGRIRRVGPASEIVSEYSRAVDHSG
jgi:homopolymeric O-antigen transport system ATP-binding protein